MIDWTDKKISEFISSFKWYQPFNMPPLDNIQGHFGFLDRETLNPALLPRSLKGKTFLEIGCNTGKYCLEAKLRGAKKVVGIDPDRKWIQRAKTICQILGIKDITYLNLPGQKIDKLGTFDYVAMFSVIHLKGIKDPMLLLKKAYGATNEIFITEIFTRFFWRHMNKFGLKLFLKYPYPTIQAFKEILKNNIGFRYVEYAGKN